MSFEISRKDLKNFSFPHELRNFVSTKRLSSEEAHLKFSLVQSASGRLGRKWEPLFGNLFLSVSEFILSRDFVMHAIHPNHEGAKRRLISHFHLLYIFLEGRESPSGGIRR
jgi:hypothetical protein